jgi:hypothetical protein
MEGGKTIWGRWTHCLPPLTPMLILMFCRQLKILMILGFATVKYIEITTFSSLLKVSLGLQYYNSQSK